MTRTRADVLREAGVYPTAHTFTLDGRMYSVDADAVAALADRVLALEAAVQAFVAWLDAEDSRPDYGGLTRDTHPNGEAIWSAWFYGNMERCDKAMRLGRETLAALHPTTTTREDA